MVKKMNNNLVSFYLFFGVFLGFFVLGVLQSG